jgi:hypothetical protein
MEFNDLTNSEANLVWNVTLCAIVLICNFLLNHRYSKILTTYVLYNTLLYIAVICTDRVEYAEYVGYAILIARPFAYLTMAHFATEEKLPWAFYIAQATFILYKALKLLPLFGTYACTYDTAIPIGLINVGTNFVVQQSPIPWNETMSAIENCICTIASNHVVGGGKVWHLTLLDNLGSDISLEFMIPHVMMLISILVIKDWNLRLILLGSVFGAILAELLTVQTIQMFLPLNYADVSNMINAAFVLHFATS